MGGDGDGDIEPGWRWPGGCSSWAAGEGTGPEPRAGSEEGSQPLALCLCLDPHRGAQRSHFETRGAVVGIKKKNVNLTEDSRQGISPLQEFKRLEGSERLSLPAELCL